MLEAVGLSPSGMDCMKAAEMHIQLYPAFCAETAPNYQEEWSQAHHQGDMLHVP
jgi:hypothetical protein